MNNLYRFLRCAALMVLMMAWMMPARAQHPFTLTTASDITNSTQHYYLIQSIDRPSFYAIPHSTDENSKVSTTSIPNANMRWYFMDAGSDSDHQYYYIVNSTGRCLYRMNDDVDGIRIKNTYAELSSLSGDELDKYKYYLTPTGSDYFIHPKGAPDLYLNKKQTNVPYDPYIKTSTWTDAPSVWNFVAVGNVTWPQPFTISTNAEKHYYKFQNVTNTSFYLSKSEDWATVSSTGSNEDVWYFLDAGTDATYSNCHYCYIVNALTGKYLYYTGGEGNDIAKVMDYNAEENDKYCFLIVDAAYKPDNTNYATSYTIVPKLRQAYFSDKDSFAPMAMTDNSHLLLKNDRSSNNYNSHWRIEETVFDLVEAPTITNNYDGTISLSTTTTGATIYYTTNGDTPDNTSTAYSSPFLLGDATVIKAIAYLDSDCSNVSTYNVPKYTKPTISYDSSTSQVTITSEGTVYYTTNGDTPTISSTEYSGPFAVEPATTVKAIATHPGYLNSEVATKYIQSGDYSQDYLTFTVLTDGTIPWKSIGSGMEKAISYRINGGSWTSITAGDNVTISVVAGDVVEFKGNNQTYAKDRSNYSGFDGGTATFNISGNIMSLIYGDNFVGQTSMSGSYNFCSLFKLSKAVSAENLILPATSLTECCYRAMFSKSTLEVAPALPATILGAYCYYYMFEECAISSAPELRAPTLVSNCYGNMFTGCRSLNYILCLAVDKSASNCLTNWVKSVSPTGTFVKDEDANWSTGASGIPTNWTVVDDGTPNVPTISCDGFEIQLSCTTTGAIIYYQLDHSGNYIQYTAPITMTDDTFIECYSEKDGKTSATISQTCEYDDRTLYEYSNQSLDSWSYRGNTITTPYSVNAIDGHSSSYARGTFTFETDVNLRNPQPTYLWFQHADQSATIYVDDILVEKHWGGYTAFFVDISEHVHKGTNHIKVALKNNEGNHLAPASADFNFNATLGNVKLFTSPYMPAMSYGYDGFHITSTVSSAEATIHVKTTIPTGATVVCTISGDNCDYTETKSSTGDELVFTTTITNPHLWNGTIDPYLYNVKLEIYHDDELYHRYERPYGLRFYEYVINQTVNGNQYTGFLLNGQPYLLRGCCMHDDIEGKANALTDTDYDNTFATIQDLGLNFLRLAHYPHPKETYDRCDRLGIVVQTEGPCVNKMQSTMPTDYYTHLEGQYTDMVNQHYNHPCIIFWGLSNETTTDDKDFAKVKIEGYKALIKNLDPERWVGYVLAQGPGLDPSGYYNNPNMDWFGCNIYVGWYASQNSNNPSYELNRRIANTITAHGKPVAYSEYGCGGTQRCHSESASTTTNKGSGGARHDIEYMMWLHEGHIATIKQYPQLLFTSQWQLFDIAVSNRNEGYTVCPDGVNDYIDDDLRRLNDKGLVERDHVTKKDPFYLYKAWWNQTDKFVHICGKDFEKLTNRVIKCYTNDGNSLSLYVNNTLIETVSVTDNIATFTARNFNPGDEIRVNGATANDTFTFTDYSEENVFITNGNWNKVSNWSGNAVPTAVSNVRIEANATIPANYVARVGEININDGATLTIADGGQLHHDNDSVTAKVQKSIVPYTIEQTTGEVKSNGWYLLASPMQVALAPSATMLSNNYDLYRFNQSAPANDQGITLEWENYHQYPDFMLNNGQGYLYANSGDGESPTVMIDMEGQLQPSDENIVVPLVYDNSIEFAGFNLVGNPFACNAYLTEPRDFLVMNATNDDLVINASVNGVIAPLQGIFVQAADANDNAVTFTRTQPETQGRGGALTLNVYKGSALRQTQEPQPVIDRTRVRFGEGQSLNKFSLKPNGTKLFVTQGLQDYAVVYAEKQGEVPVNFKAAENGCYTISASTENTELRYLHLIDNLTGADVDLLTSPTYTFEAKTTDYASRFRLVFSVNETDSSSTGSGTFAFIINGNIIVNGEGMLQIVDIMGRVIASTDVAHNISTSGMTPGVYVLRLINGNDVKTQKIVVR